MATRKKRRAAGSPLTQERLLQAAHEVWLAGIGAVTRAQREGPKLFEQLLRDGSQAYATTRGSAGQALQSAVGRIQSSVGPRVEQARAQAGEALDALEKIFQTRVHRALGQIGVPSSDEIAALSRRVDRLNRNVEQLARARKGAAGAPRRGRTARPKAKRAAAS